MFPKKLRIEILLLLGAKAAALTLLYFLFFAPGPATQAHAIVAHLLSAGSH